MSEQVCRITVTERTTREYEMPVSEFEARSAESIRDGFLKYGEDEWSKWKTDDRCLEYDAEVTIAAVEETGDKCV